MVSAETVEHRPKIIEPRKVAEPKGAAADLVLVSRSDAAPGGADFAGPTRILAQSVEIAVDRKDQRAGVGDHQDLGRDCDALLAKLLDLSLQCPRIEHYAVADDRRRAGDNPRRD